MEARSLAGGSHEKDGPGGIARRGARAAVKVLVEAIIAFLAERNAHPKSYVWNANGDDILRKLVLARNRTESIYA